MVIFKTVYFFALRVRKTFLKLLFHWKPKEVVLL